jgi:hypothetical protein
MITYTLTIEELLKFKRAGFSAHSSGATVAELEVEEYFVHAGIDPNKDGQ